MKNGITRQIMAGYGDLRKSEKKAADYILDHLEEAAGASIDRLAKAAEVSQPTVLRTLRALGFRGYKDFKYRLVSELALEAVRDGGGAADGTFVRLHAPEGDDPGGDPCSCDRDSVQDAGRDAEKHFCEDIQKGGGCTSYGKIDQHLQRRELRSDSPGFFLQSCSIWDCPAGISAINTISRSRRETSWPVTWRWESLTQGSQETRWV